MIIKGTSRGGARQLGEYLNSPGENENIEKLEIRGTAAQDVPGAINEMDAYALGTRCEKSLYHAMINPEPPNRLSFAQCMEAVDALEHKLGFTDHARVVVLHEKHGRQHLHVVWTRIDIEQMKAVHLGHNYRKHEEVSRDLERRFGHARIQGVHAERDGKNRPARTPTRAELRQEERTGIKSKDVREEVTALFKSCDTAEAFRAALADKGYVLAKGDRRDFVIVDKEGGIHSLARRIEGINAVGLRIFMAPIDRELLQSARVVRAEIRQEPELPGRKSVRTEADYAGGDGYVTQSGAALRDHMKKGAAVRTSNSRAERIAERLAKLKEAESRATGPSSGNSQDGDPDRQRKAPGNGRSRSR